MKAGEGWDEGGDRRAMLECDLWLVCLATSDFQNSGLLIGAEWEELTSCSLGGGVCVCVCPRASADL